MVELLHLYLFWEGRLSFFVGRRDVGELIDLKIAITFKEPLLMTHH